MLSTYTSLDDYDAMFEARHGRGAVDNNLMTTGGMVSTTLPITLPTEAESVSIRATNKDPVTRQIPIYTPSGVPSLSSQPDQTPIGEDNQPQVEEDAAPPVGVGHILGEGAAVFTDMTETMLTDLDKQMAQPDTVLRSVSSPVNTLHAPDSMLTQSGSREGTHVTRAPQPRTSPIPTQGPNSCPFLLQWVRMHTLICIYLLQGIIGLVTSFMCIQIVHQQIIIL